MFKKIFKDKKAAIFDLDGTLLDTKHLYREVWTEVLDDLGIGSEEFMARIGTGAHISDTLNSISQKVGKLPVAASEIQKRVFGKFLQKLPESGLDVTEGFWPLVSELKDKGYKIALVTNTPRDHTEKILDYLNIHQTFDQTVCGDEVKKPKPDPEMYKVAAKKLGVKPKDVVVFEDSPVGVSAALKAGMDVVVIWDEEIFQEDYPEGVAIFVNTFDNLVGKLDQDFDDLLKEVREACKDELKS